MARRQVMGKHIGPHLPNCVCSRCGYGMHLSDAKEAPTECPKCKKPTLRDLRIAVKN